MVTNGNEIDSMLIDGNLGEYQNIVEANRNDILVNDGITSLIYDNFAPIDDDNMVHNNLLIDLTNNPLYER